MSILSNKQSISDNIISEDMLLFELHEMGCDLAGMKISYKLTKTTTKTEKFGKSLQMCNIINFKTIRYKMTATGNIIHSMLNYKFMRPILQFTATYRTKK